MLTATSVQQRNCIKFYGNSGPVLLLAHGFGCNQQMWRFLLPVLSQHYQLVLFDYVGSGQSDLQAYCPQRYASLTGYAQDIIDIVTVLDLQDVTLIGHSVSAMICMLAAQQIPDRIRNLIMVCPSPCYLNDLPAYAGGFEKTDLVELLDLMDKNYLGWANYLAPLVIGSQDEMFSGELADSFCSTDPVIAKSFAKATFFTDFRAQLPDIRQPVLLLQSQFDSLAPLAVGQFMQQQIPCAQLVVFAAKGHCLHMTHPVQVSSAILQFLTESRLCHP